MALQSLCWTMATFSVWTGHQPVARPLPNYRTTQIQNNRTQLSMPQFGTELTIPAFEREKTVHVLDSAAIVIGSIKSKTIRTEHVN
jgi:hypothetical protein